MLGGLGRADETCVREHRMSAAGVGARRRTSVLLAEVSINPFGLRLNVPPDKVLSH